MIRRTVTTLLWLLMGWSIGGMLEFMAGWPAMSGPIIGVALAALIWLDPTHSLWTRTQATAPGPRTGFKLPTRRVVDPAKVGSAEPVGQTESAAHS